MFEWVKQPESTYLEDITNQLPGTDQDTEETSSENQKEVKK